MWWECPHASSKKTCRDMWSFAQVRYCSLRVQKFNLTAIILTEKVPSKRITDLILRNMRHFTMMIPTPLLVLALQLLQVSLQLLHQQMWWITYVCLKGKGHDFLGYTFFIWKWSVSGAELKSSFKNSPSNSVLKLWTIKVNFNFTSCVGGACAMTSQWG